MPLWLRSLLVLIVAAPMSTPAAPREPWARGRGSVRMGQVGAFAGARVTLVDGEPVLALYRRTAGWALERRTVRVTSVLDTNTDAPGQPSARAVSVVEGSEGEDPLMLFAGLAGTGGPVPAAVIPPECFADNKDCSVPFGNTAYALHVYVTETADLGTAVHAGGFMAFAGKINVRVMGSVELAGDLDGDGRLDLLIAHNIGLRTDSRRGVGLLEYGLHLSSAAKTTETVRGLTDPTTTFIVEPAATIYMTPVGAFMDENIFAQDGERMLGLYHDAAGWRLQTRPVRVERPRSRAKEQAIRGLGTRVSVAGAPPLMLLSARDLQEGPLVAVDVPKPCLGRDVACDIRLGTTAYHLEGREVSAEDQEGNPDFALEVSVPGAAALTLPAGTLLFSGDLDRDGRLDVLTARRCAPTAFPQWTDYRLFLSSRAAVGALAGEAFRLLARVASSFHLAIAGSFHGDEIVAFDGETMFGLRQVAGRWHLDAARVRITREMDPIVDADTERTGKVVAVEGLAGEPPLILLGGPGLRAGPVTAAPLPPDCLVEGRECELSLGPRRYQVAVLEARTVSVEGLSKPRYALRLSEGESAGVVTGVVTFAGDLDRDGRLDLLIENSYHYNVSFSYLLLLSSPAPRGELFVPVAQFSSVGC